MLELIQWVKQCNLTMLDVEYCLKYIYSLSLSRNYRSLATSIQTVYVFGASMRRLQGLSFSKSGVAVAIGSAFVSTHCQSKLIIHVTS